MSSQKFCVRNSSSSALQIIVTRRPFSWCACSRLPTSGEGILFLDELIPLKRRNGWECSKCSLNGGRAKDHAL